MYPLSISAGLLWTLLVSVINSYGRKFEASEWEETHFITQSTEVPDSTLSELSHSAPLCRCQHPLKAPTLNVCPSEEYLVKSINKRPLFDDEIQCWYLLNLYESQSWKFLSSNAIPSTAASPAAPVRLGSSPDGVIDYVPMPCPQCETDRKDRSFILGQLYTNSMTKLLVDYASSHAGAKILASSDNLQGISDILAADDNRYLLSQCANKVWFTIRLADEVFIEKIGLIASELFASTFRHIQILGSRQYPTSEWRLLGEIETNPLETQEWFDISASSDCSKCYVKYLKIRVLTHHALEGYTNCALTRIQVFGSTLLQSLDKIQNMNSTSGSGTPGSTANRDPAFVKIPFDKLQAAMVVTPPESSDTVTKPPNLPVAPIPPTPPPVVPQESSETKSKEESSNPLLVFVEEMTLLKKQYAAMSHSLYSMNEALRAEKSANSTTSAPEWITISVLGTRFIVSRNWDGTKLLMIVLVVVQCITMYMVLKRNGRVKIGDRSQSVVIDVRKNTDVSDSSSEIHELGKMKNPKIFATPLKKRNHGIWKPRIRRSVFYHYMGIPSKGEEVSIAPVVGDQSLPTLAGASDNNDPLN